MKKNIWITPMNNKLIVKKKSVYGNDLVYPMCEQSKIFACISGNKTLLASDILLIKKLGYELTTESEKI
jgi:hypothetical protein